MGDMFYLLSAISLIIGYLIGSFSPGYFIGKLLKGKNFDIRKYGKNKNTGASNVKQVLGLRPAIFTAILDIIKGVIAIIITNLLTSNQIVVLLSGFMALIGHVFPFYLQFHGGKGAATAWGILIYGLIVIITNKINFSLILFFVFIVLTLLMIILLIITKNQDFIAITFIPLFIMFLYFITKFDKNSWYALLAILYLFILSILVTINKLKIKIKKMSTLEKKLLRRKILRPFAIVFPIGLLYVNKIYVIIILLIVFLFFLIFEILRFIKPRLKVYPLVYKKTESKKISSMVSFLFSCILTILIFDKYIAAIALLFLIFGDLFAWIVGKTHGKIKLLKKTLEGTVTNFVVCASIVFIFYVFFNFVFWVGLIGALTAALVELSPIQDDNLAIPLISSIIMTAIS